MAESDPLVDTPPRYTWPAEGLARVPYWAYRDAAIYAREQSRVFGGATWNFLCLEAELPGPNTYRTTFIGEMPVVVTRDTAGAIHAFENRCAHRGALLCLKQSGAAEEFVCIYHNWTYDLEGNLTGVAFRRGIRGQGGMAANASPESQAPTKVRVTTFSGLVFGTLSAATLPIERYISPAIVPRIERVFPQPVKVLGRYTQVLPNNWKLYMENVRDTYHASLLHLFYTTFRLNRLNQKGGLIIGDGGRAHASFTLIDTDAGGNEYEDAKMRSAAAAFRLAAPEVLESVDELGDGVSIQILSVFPNLLLQQIKNCLAVRQTIPLGLDRTAVNWTLFGFTTDDEAMTRLRLMQSNLVGPAGYVSMEDGAATGFVQRGIAGAHDRQSVLEMGGTAVATQESRMTEASVRGFWQAWREAVDI